MWCSRRLVLAGLPLALAGCVGGYAPLDEVGAEGLRRGEIEIAPPASEDEFALVAALENRLGQPGRASRWRLSWTLRVSEDPVGVRPDEATQRFNVIGRIDWRLVSIASGAVRSADHFSSFTSYSATESPVAGLSAQADAHTRLMELLAEQLVLRLRAALATPAAG